MKELLSIRMRASKRVGRRKTESKDKESGFFERHISGAEGIYRGCERAKVVEGYIERALSHPKGRPDRIVITIEKMGPKPRMIEALPVTTLHCRSNREARGHIRTILDTIGVSENAYRNALKVLNNGNAMRGASLILCKSGRRVEPDKKRGIRASRLGIDRNAGKKLSIELSLYDINTTTVKEALVLASKVATCGQVMAELCISDDPGYTTGYVSSRKYGYVRVRNMKGKGDKNGGRVFFLKEDADIESVINFLENTSVIITRTGGCRGSLSIDEILNHHHI
jgi:6-carboxyhexanoate--CoA ligase